MIYLLVLALTGLLLLAIVVHCRSYPPYAQQAAKAVFAFATVAALGALTGLYELASRYRDAPIDVAASTPGVTYMLANAAIAMLALLIIERYHLADDTDTLRRVVIAGFGGMVVLRARVFSLRSASGSDLAIGPALVLDYLLGMVNREVDRMRAGDRHKMVVDTATRLKAYRFDKASPYLLNAMGAFQALDSDERERIAKTIQELATNADWQSLPDLIKYATVGFSLLTAFGERVFTTVFDGLKLYLEGLGAQALSAPPQPSPAPPMPAPPAAPPPAPGRAAPAP